MTKVDVKVRILMERAAYIPERRPNVTRKTLIDLVNTHLRGDCPCYAGHSRERAVSVHHPYFRKDQIESASFCPRVLVRVDHPVQGYYVAMGFTCYDATKLVRGGKTLKVMETKNGKEIVAV